MSVEDTSLEPLVDAADTDFGATEGVEAGVDEVVGVSVGLTAFPFPLEGVLTTPDGSEA